MSYLSVDKQCELFNVKKPYQYIGSEYLSSNKDFNSAKVKMVFAFPDKYEIAISNLGQKILYSKVNSHEEYMADRVYAPDFDYKKILEDNNETLTSLEEQRFINDFDIVGFSLQYELAYPAMLEMLKLSKIPLYRTERHENMPLIVAGGPCCFNPEPIEDFIDLFMIGDGEDVIIDLLDCYYKMKSTGKSRNQIIYELSNIEGIYSPEYPKKTKKRIYYFKPDDIITKAPIPYSSSIHDRTIIEIRRGCGRMCRFCQAGHVNLPIRERNAKDIISKVEESVSVSGYDEYSLLSLSSNDYSNIESTIECLSDKLNKRKISVSLPSQRIDRYSQNLARLVKGVRKTTVTLAPEAGSQRLRDVINKNLTEEQVINTILNCYKNGFSHIKLYFMIGLPTETFEDLEEMVELLKKIRWQSKAVKKELQMQEGLNITCTISIFVPKPFTPFQWFGQNSHEQIREKIKFLTESIKTLKGIKINYHNSFVSKLECVLTRGDKRLNKFLYELNKQGVYLSTWDENIDRQLWIDIAEKCGIDIDYEAQREYKTDEKLPWDIIDIGITKEWMIEQYKNALNSVNIVPCEFKCVNCGVCKRFNTRKILDKPFKYTKNISELPQKTNTPQEIFKYRVKISKENELRYISHLDWQNTIIKMLYRSGLNLCFSQGFNPTPKISLGIALPLFVESDCELIDIDIYDNRGVEELKSIFNRILPENIKVKEIKKITKQTESIDILAQWALYSFSPFKKGILKNEDLLYIKDKISSSNEIFIEKINKKGIKKLVNIKQSIKSIEVNDDVIYMILKTGQSEDIPSVKPDDVIKLYIDNVDFRIIRRKFYDENMNEL